MDEWSADVMPWGDPGTPVLPAWFVQALGDQPLPSAVADSCPEFKTFADLSRYWEVANEPLSRDLRQELVAASRSVAMSSELVAIPAGISSDQLASLPLTVRAANAIRRSDSLPSVQPVTARRLLQLPNFGFTSLVELLCVLEAAGPLAARPVLFDGAQPAVPIATPASWEGMHPFIESLLPVLSVARDVLACRTVADVLRSPRLVEVLKQTGALEHMSALELNDVPSEVGPISALINAVRSVESDHGSENVELFLRRKVDGTETLASLGEERGVTRERVRQLETRVARALEDRGTEHAVVIASLISSELPPIAESKLVDERIDAILHPEIEAAGNDLYKRIQALTRYLIRFQLKLATNGSLALNEEGQNLVSQLSSVVSREVDDVGLVDLYAIVAREAPNGLPVMDHLVDVLGLTRIGEHLALRDTLRVRAKLALLEIGRPATKEEIARAGGIAVATLGSTLSNIDSVARADKDKWGLVTWIDDVYEGIPAEIQQRIDEHGGAVSLGYLLEDIPTRFGVSEASVRSYVTTRQFNLVDGMVSTADENSITYRPVEDVATRNGDGELCWDFKVEARYFDGFSITGFPPELAREVGCGPNDRCDVPITMPAGCDAVSVIWRLTSVNGAAEIGRARDALVRVGVVAGDRARLVISRDGSVRFERGDELLRPSTADDLLDRLKSRRRIS